MEFFVLFHTPGPQWHAGVAPRDQPGIHDHYAFAQRMLDERRVVLGGPFVDDENGGMFVLRADSAADAERLAHEDQAVRSGLLAVRIRPWRVITATIDIED